MFTSKPIGWITAVTLLGVAGMALACRLTDGSGDAVQASSGEKDVVPAPTPLPPPPPQDTEKEVGAPPVSDAPPPPVMPPSKNLAPEPVKEPVPPPPPPTKLPEPINEIPLVKETTPTPPPVEIKPVPAPLPTAEPLKPIAEVKTTPAVPAIPAEHKAYWAAAGDTLREIARRSLGSEDRWRELEKLNPELRARTMIPSGTLVRLPVDAKVASTLPKGGQAESEDPPVAGKVGGFDVKPLPLIRAKPECGKCATPLMGTFNGKIDARRGLTIPVEVLEQLGKCDKVLLTPAPDRCLWLVTETGAARVQQRVEKAQVGDAEVQAFRRLYFSQTEKSPVDEGSRIQVSEKLADYAGLTGEYVLIGIDDHFELWDAARWHRYSRQKSATSPSSRETDE